MKPIFQEQEALRIPAYEMVLEMEDLPIPRRYDQGGDPPRVRIVLKSPEITVACDHLHELARSVSATNFPIAEFIGRYPGQVASMIAALEGFRRPVQDDELFGFVEAAHNVRLSEIKPRFENGDLQWFEGPAIYVKELNERRLTVPALSMTEGRRIPPAVRYGDASPKPEA